MHLYCVTLTGADDDVPVDRLADLTREFPYVEWGILFSPKRQGSPRYPSRDWLNEFTRKYYDWLNDTGQEFPCAAHLCGNHARSFIRGHYSWYNHIGGCSQPHIFRRLQINIPQDVWQERVDFKSAVGDFNNYLKVTGNRRPGVIFQIKDASLLESIATLGPGDYKALFDVSGGQGVCPETWPEPPVYAEAMGYAGGLSPDNVADHLHRLEEVVGDLPVRVWIDMESGVRDRDSDTFDLDKCRRVLEAVQPWV